MVLLAVLAVGALVWLLIAQPWRADGAEGGAVPRPVSTMTAATPDPTSPGATATPGPTASATVAPDQNPSTQALPVCAAPEVTVEAITDQTTYAPDQNPQLSIRLRNGSASDCSINVGTAAQSFTITSGVDVWWRSTDCQTEPSDMVVTLSAGQEVTSAAPLVWDRTRSAVATCQDPNRQRAAGGGASYHLAVEIGGIRSTGTAQFLLY
jgi:hypothetical protein